MNIKMTTNLLLSTTESKQQQQKLSKQPEQEQNHRYGDHLEGYQLGRGKGTMGAKMQGLKSIIGRYKIDRGMLRIVWEWRHQRMSMHDPWTSTKWGIAGGKGSEYQAQGGKSGKTGTTLIT